MSYKSFKEGHYQIAIANLEKLQSDYKYKKDTDLIIALLQMKKYSVAKLKYKSIILNDDMLYKVYLQQGLSGWYSAEYYMTPGITLYYGEGDEKFAVGKIVNFERKYSKILGDFIDCVNVRMKKNGTVACKDKIAVATWYVNENDPAFRRR